MTDRHWPESEKHPPLSAMLLHMDGDLNGPESAAITQHFRDCWECRARCDKLERGIHAFMEYRQEVLLPSIPAPSPQRHVFRRRSREALAGLRTNAPLGLLGRMARSVFAGPRVATGITAVISAAVLIFLMAIPVAHPQKLTAAELIQRARASAIHGLPVRPVAGGQLAKKVVYQKIQFRSGNRTIEREVVLGGANAGADTAPPDAEWTRLLAATPIDWRDPLGVDRYERWREGEGKGRDTVSEADGFATLNTIPAGQSLIESASLTVRESDWHPVAKRVDFVDRTALEVRELDYGVRDVPEPEKVAVSAEPRVRAAGLAAAPAPDAPSGVDLDEAEVSLREKLHKVGADVDEVLEIIRDGPVIRFRASTETLERKQELLAAVQGIPHIAAEVFDPGTSISPNASAGSRQASDTQIYSTAPPLIKALQDYLGGLDTANTYLHGIRDSYREVLMDTSALQRLADRYSGTEWERLPPELRIRVNRLAADYVDSVQRNSDIYLRQMSLALDEMLSRSKLAAYMTGESGPVCLSWRTDSAAVAEDLRRLETAFQRLFVVEKTDRPITLSAETLLLESAQLRARFSGEIGHFCSSEPQK